MSRIRVVYCAGPLSADSRQGELENVRAAMRVATRLRDAGLAVVLPHLGLYWNDHHPTDYETWLRMDLALIERTDALLRIAPSPGTDREVAHAVARGIPVFFRVEDLLKEAGR